MKIDAWLCRVLNIFFFKGVCRDNTWEFLKSTTPYAWKKTPTTRPAVILAGESLEVTVIVKGTKIALCDRLSEALLVLELAHFVFHQKTKRGTRKANWLLRTVVFDVEQDMEPD